MSGNDLAGGDGDQLLGGLVRIEFLEAFQARGSVPLPAMGLDRGHSNAAERRAGDGQTAGSDVGPIRRSSPWFDKTCQGFKAKADSRQVSAGRGSKGQESGFISAIQRPIAALASSLISMN